MLSARRVYVVIPLLVLALFLVLIFLYIRLGGLQRTVGEDSLQLKPSGSYPTEDTLPIGLTEAPAPNSLEFPGGMVFYNLSGIIIQKPYTDDEGFFVLPLGSYDGLASRTVYLKQYPYVGEDDIARISYTQKESETWVDGRQTYTKVTTLRPISEAVEFFGSNPGKQVVVYVATGATYDDTANYLRQAMQASHCGQECQNRLDALLDKQQITTNSFNKLIDDTGYQALSIYPIVLSIEVYE